METTLSILEYLGTFKLNWSIATTLSNSRYAMIFADLFTSKVQWPSRAERVSFRHIFLMSNASGKLNPSTEIFHSRKSEQIHYRTEVFATQKNRAWHLVFPFQFINPRNGVPFNETSLGEFRWQHTTRMMMEEFLANQFFNDTIRKITAVVKYSIQFSVHFKHLHFLNYLKQISSNSKLYLPKTLLIDSKFIFWNLRSMSAENFNKSCN